MEEINVKLFPGTPVAERITEFGNFKVRKCPNIIGQNEVSVEENALFDKNVLCYNVENTIYQFAEEELKAIYRCKRDGSLAGKGYLNPFVKEIRVAEVKHGRKIALYGTSIQTFSVKEARIAYYETIGNEKRGVKPYPLQEFLLDIPELFLTKEGILIFYSEKKMIATVDLEHFARIEVPGGYDASIKKVEAWTGDTLVTVNDKGSTFNYTIKFYSEKIAYGCIRAEFTMV